MSENNEKKGWFERFIPTPYKPTYTTPTYYTGYSPSRFVESYSSNWYFSSYEKKEENYVAKVRQALQTLRKNANLISNSLVGEDHLKVNFAKNGETNDFNGNEFKVSPDLLLNCEVNEDGSYKIDAKEGDEYYDAIDALTGQILVGCQIRKNANEQALREFQSSRDRSARHVYQTLEEGKAFDQIAEDWVGFTPYLQAHREKFHADKPVVENFLGQATAESLTAGLCWNHMHSDDKIDLGEKYKEVESKFMEHMLKYDSVEPQHRFAHAQQAFNLVKELFPAKGGDTPGGGAMMSGKSGEGDSGDSGKGKSSDSGDSGKGESKENDKKDDGKGDSKPKKDKKDTPDDLLDDSLFGSPIKSGSEISDDKLKEINTSVAGDGRAATDLLVHLDPDIKINNPCKDSECAKKYKDFVRSQRGAIKGVEKSFLFRNNEARIANYGLTVGSLDEHSLIKIPMGDMEHLYCRHEVLSQKDTGIGLLLDQSGSMGGHKILQARQCVIVLREALRNIKGIKLAIYGHTAHAGPRFSGDETADDPKMNVVDIFPYMDETMDNSEALIQARSTNWNLDGFAIRYVADRLLKMSVAHRMLFVVCDGKPNGYGYRGHASREHTFKCVQAARRSGISVFAIGIKNAFDNAIGTELYGEDGFVVINDVESSLGILIREIKRFLNRQQMRTA